MKVTIGVLPALMQDLSREQHQTERILLIISLMELRMAGSCLRAIRMPTHATVIDLRNQNVKMSRLVQMRIIAWLMLL